MMREVADAPLRAAIYLRISQDRELDGLAIERQREDCENVVAQHKWTVAPEHVYTDQSISATDASVNRPAYDRLVRDFDAREWDALVCWDLDRLTRQPRQLEDWIDRAESRGLRIVTANGEADLGTDSGRLFASEGRGRAG
jgi:site-specific DNA recombinase